MTASVWGQSDCLTEILGDFERPHWLASAPTSQEAFARFVKRYDGDIAAGAKAFGVQFAKDFKRIPNDAEHKPGDVVVGKTREHAFVIAKVSKSYLPIMRSEIGFDVAKFTEIIGKWRRL